MLTVVGRLGGSQATCDPLFSLGRKSGSCLLRGWSRRWVLVQKQYGTLSMTAVTMGVLRTFQNLNWVPIIGVGGTY